LQANTPASTITNQTAAIVDGYPRSKVDHSNARLYRYVETVSVDQSGPPFVVIHTRSKIFILPMNDSTTRFRIVGRISGMTTCQSFAVHPQLSSSAASSTSEGSECMAASSTTMLKPVHIHVVTKISDGSAIRGSPIHA